MLKQLFVDYLMFLRRLAEEAAAEAARQGETRVDEEIVDKVAQVRLLFHCPIGSLSYEKTICPFANSIWTYNGRVIQKVLSEFRG